MKVWIIVIALLAVSSHVFAQLGGIGRRVQQPGAQAAVRYLTLPRKRKSAGAMSAQRSARASALRRCRVHKYVTLVGNTLTDHTSRPKRRGRSSCSTDGVNAWPPRRVRAHTRGALALINRKPSSGVLARDRHVAQKHTVNAIRRPRRQIGTARRRLPRAFLVARDRAYDWCSKSLRRATSSTRQGRHSRRAKAGCAAPASRMPRALDSATRARQRRTACLPPIQTQSESQR